MPGTPHTDVRDSYRDARRRLKGRRCGRNISSKEPHMPAVARIDPKTVFSPEEWSRLTARSSLRGMLLVAHAWGTIAAAIALVALWPNPLTWLVALMIVGTRQLGLAILMHEAAHGGLHANKMINEWIGQ